MPYNGLKTYSACPSRPVYLEVSLGPWV